MPAGPDRGGDSGLAADREPVCGGCAPDLLLYDCGVSTGLEIIYKNTFSF